MNSRLNQIETIKENLNLNKYDKYIDLKNDIETVIDEFWSSDKYIMNDDLFDMDLEEISKFHAGLIAKVSDIHECERESKNEKLIENNVDMKFISKSSVDSKSAHKIYTFNKKRDYIFVGDLHSDDHSLKRVLKDARFFEGIVSKEKKVLIFNGDYVDRGKTHLKIMERILVMKYLFPNHIFLLRGNHDGGKILEDGTIKLPYGIPNEDDNNMYFPKYLEYLILKNKSLPKFFLKNYLDFFDTLSYIAIVNIENETIMAVHGGIPRPDNESEMHYHYINSLKDLTDESIVDEQGRTMCQNIMWSDPYREGEYREKLGRYHYKQEHIDSFMEKFKVDFVIRGHEEAENGYWYALEDKVVTIFASGSLNDLDEKTDNEESWYTKINPKILKIRFEGERIFL